MRIPSKRSFVKFVLDENCRNTKNIVGKLKEIINMDIRSLSGIPEGEPVVVINYRNDVEQQTLLLIEIRKLIGVEGVPTEKILILLNTDFSKSCLANTKNINKIPIQKLNERGQLSLNAINYTHINTFKGLEADIVFIIDRDKVPFDEKVLYTQASRAKHKLYLFEKV